MAQNQTFNDKQIASVLLTNHKQSAQSLTNLVLESANQGIRQDAQQILQTTFQHQKAIWDYMNQKGYYQVDMAPQQEITKAQQQIQQQMGIH
ncbi:MAG: spore coat protein [Xylanivirga thermophila]|uniref:spore coat protein n=1 Tax=Xylanivirga thermophila TaxID=2496273 RepID=UPI00101DB4D6|nr:spore coat protein [Xylanivirga thermophila]